MDNNVRRIYVEKKAGYDIEARALYGDITENLGIRSLEYARIVNRYDIQGISDEEYGMARRTIFSEPPVDVVYDERIDMAGCRAFAVEFLPGQYDQRADSASQCIQILTQGERPDIKYARVIILGGDISDQEFDRIKSYCINPVDSTEASFEKPESLGDKITVPENVETLEGFIDMDSSMLEDLKLSRGFAMDIEDLKFCMDYFKNIEKRNPTITELRVIDTYWSDHCRHTTFNTKLENITIEKGRFSEAVERAFLNYIESRKYVYRDETKDMNLMDVATIAMKELKARGEIPDLDISDEINACSIEAEVDVDGERQQWLIMFKNETHNHPTEIEPFGGAATCLGGAIRDPLSGRAYVYQAMRVTGSADPRARVEDTIPGKLPQRKITTGAAAGYSSYGNQIGLATGHVSEVYDEGFAAKRMEIGAVIGAVPKKNVVRQVPCPGDRVILVGGKTGRDGCGGATGSSKEHDERSILSCGAEVQKGNALTERKLQRLFRNPRAGTMIKRCNDFGAGGVAVAVGELSDGLVIDLDAVPKKYDGLDGTELSISESQERMAVVVESRDVEKFVKYAAVENLEAVEVARVTGDGRLRMLWNNNVIVDISRNFLNTNGVTQKRDVHIKAPEGCSYFSRCKEGHKGDVKEAWLDNLQDLNVCSQRGLVERFDSTVGAGTVLMPFGGIYQLTPAQSMAAKIPVMQGDTSTGTVMSCGYDPAISKWSPFHGAVYAVVEAAAKIVSAGCDYRNIRLTLQEYFGKPGNDPERWGKPLASLLGAYYAQMGLGIPAIGGKDSMSGTFKDLDVPPTLVAFAVSVADVNTIISPEFKKPGSPVVLIRCPRDKDELPVFSRLADNFSLIYRLIMGKKVLSAYAVGAGGVAAAVSKMAFGNRIGIAFDKFIDIDELFCPEYGSIVLELCEGSGLDEMLDGTSYTVLGRTSVQKMISVGGISVELDEAIDKWQRPLEKVFPTIVKSEDIKIEDIPIYSRSSRKSSFKNPSPRVFIPVFPGTNCEYDMARAFENAGGVVDTLVVKNLSSAEIEEIIGEMAERISYSQIIALPGGFSGGDEPDGSGKFIAAAFRNPRVCEAVMELLYKRDGLILGICNGFQALIKLGLLPYGKITAMDDSSPTLTYNSIGRHVSRMVRTKVVSTLSPWLSGVRVGDIHTIPVSHGEGRFTASPADMAALIRNGQVAAQYVDFGGSPSSSILYNPNGSLYAVEGITSPDGRILGKMGHSERMGSNVCKNVPGEKDQKIFESGVNYFK